MSALQISMTRVICGGVIQWDQILGAEQNRRRENIARAEESTKNTRKEERQRPLLTAVLIQIPPQTVTVAVRRINVGEKPRNIEKSTLKQTCSM